MKFLWMSNAPWAGTGYGQQTKLLLNSLQQLGLDPTCFCFYGLSGNKIQYDGYTCLPNSDYDDWGNDVIALHAERSQSEIVVTLMDLFVLNVEVWRRLEQPWVAWVPVDAETIGPPNRQRLDIVDYPVAMSEFGAKQMEEAGIQVADMIYHCVDTDVFAPGDKAASRDLLGLDQDAFVIGMVMANKGNRKAYPEQLQAVKQFVDKNPDLKVQVFIHTDPTIQMGGWDMKGLVAELGLKGSVFSTNQYDVSVVPAPAEFMAQVYNSFDVLMNCSNGEGFGIPIIEAQACGVPVLAGNYTAMSELIYNGYAIEADARIRVSHYGFQFIPSVEDMVYRLDCVNRMLGKVDADLGRAWVVAECSVPVIATKWANLISQVSTMGKRINRPPAALPEGYQS